MLVDQLYPAVRRSRGVELRLQSEVAYGLSQMRLQLNFMGG